MKEESNLKKYLEEGVKLGHFEPEVLNVDINDIRKGIMPEFPKDPPPEMIGGYSAKSRLVRKDPELPPFINVTRKDLAKNHKLTDKEIQDFLDDVKRINDYIKKNPAELIYAMTRYPKDDPRLAQLNFKMDEMKRASDAYVETHFPENVSLFNKLQNKIRQNIEMTDPKNFTGHAEAPKFIQNEITEQERRRKTIIKHFGKKKKKSKQIKTNNLQESNWTPVTGSIANSTSQTFHYSTPNLETGEPNTFTTSGLGGVESLPSSVKVDFGFNENPPGGVNPPSYNQLALAGYTKPILMKRRDPEEVNPKLDASQEFTKEIDAEVGMNARVEDSVDSALLSDMGYKSAEDILAEVGDQWTYEEYMKMMNDIGDRAAAKSLPITKKILEYSPGGKNPGQVPISLIDAQEAITIARHKAEDALARAWERYNKVPEPSGYGTDPSRDTETEARPVSDPNDTEAIPVPDPNDDVLDQLAKKLGVGSAKNFVDHYIDNFIRGDGKQNENLTNLLSNKDMNWLKNNLKGESAINNPKKFDNPEKAFEDLMQRAPRGIRNSIGNGAKLDFDYYKKTGDYKIDKTYIFTSMSDLEYRGIPNVKTFGGYGPSLTKPFIDAPKNYAKVKMLGNVSSMINNPMQFHVIIPGSKKKKKKVNESNTLSKIKKILKEKK